jgi:hypothetical protein
MEFTSQGLTMSSASVPHQTPEGIAFTVKVDYVPHDCLITDEALRKLSALGSTPGSEMDSMEIYQAYEARINGIARRLVAAGVKGTPLRVNANSLVSNTRPQ